MGQKWAKNGPKTGQKRAKNGPKTGQKWAKNEPKMAKIEYYPIFYLPAMPLDSVGSRIPSAK